MDAAATKKNEHSAPVDQFELVFGFWTDKILNFENPMAAGVAHRGIAARGCREGACIHVDFDGAGRFDILAAGLGSSSYIFEFLRGFSHLLGSLLSSMAFVSRGHSSWSSACSNPEGRRRFDHHDSMALVHPWSGLLD